MKRQRQEETETGREQRQEETATGREQRQEETEEVCGGSLMVG